jgi:hypothetical protein
MDDSDRPAPNLRKGLPQTTHSALTPSGEIEQATKIAEGLRQRREGWRRIVFMAGIVVVALMAAFMLAFAFFSAAQQ